MMHNKDFSKVSSIKEHIDQIYNGYVMNQQRDVHSASMGTSQSGNAGSDAELAKIELF